VAIDCSEKVPDAINRNKFALKMQNSIDTLFIVPQYLGL